MVVKDASLCQDLNRTETWGFYPRAGRSLWTFCRDRSCIASFGLFHKLLPTLWSCIAHHTPPIWDHSVPLTWTRHSFWNSLPATSPPTYITAPHPSKQARYHSLMDEGVPSLMWDGYSRSVFYRMQSFHPQKHFSCCITIINYLLRQPHLHQVLIPHSRQVVCESSIQPHAWRWGGGSRRYMFMKWMNGSLLSGHIKFSLVSFQK